MKADPLSDDFVPGRDLPKLHRWVERLCADGRWTLNGLFNLWQKHPSTRPKAGLNTLRRFMEKPEGARYGSTAQALAGFWEFLSSKSEFVRYSPDFSATKEQALAEVFPDPDELLAFVVGRFVERGISVKHKTDLAAMKKMLPGRYVMYRLDMEPAVRKMTPRQLIRASLVEIELSRGESPCLRLKETQDFPATSEPEREKHSQTDAGVLIPNGKHMIGIMSAVERASLKCMVIEDFAPVFNQHPLSTFIGKFLVASELASCPSVKFVCRRFDDKAPPHHGLYPYDAIHEDDLRWLTTPSLPGYELIS